MAIVSKPYTFTVGATIIAAEHNSNFDTIYNDYNGNITDANLSGSFSLDDAKIGQITTYGKVTGAAITNIDTLNSAAGYIPVANLNAIPNTALATVGTGAGYLVTCATTNKLPALDGSALTGVISSYDSDWFAVSSSSNYTKTHSLGTTKLIIDVFYSADGATGIYKVRNWDAENGYSVGYLINAITTTQLTIYTAAQGVTLTAFPNTATASGYYRIIALALP